MWRMPSSRMALSSRPLGERYSRCTGNYRPRLVVRATISAAVTSLDDVELAAWRGLLHLHAALMKELDAELEAAHGLSLSSYEVLLALGSVADGRMRMSEVADSVLLSRSGLTRLCDRLVRDGLIERCGCDTDRRGAYAEITSEGRRRLDEAQATHLGGVRARFLARFSHEELRRMAGLWERALPGATG